MNNLSEEDLEVIAFLVSQGHTMKYVYEELDGRIFAMIKKRYYEGVFGPLGNFILLYRITSLINSLGGVKHDDIPTPKVGLAPMSKYFFPDIKRKKNLTPKELNLIRIKEIAEKRPTQLRKLLDEHFEQFG